MIARNIVTFGRVLRAGGVGAGPERLRDALAALDAVDVGASNEVYWALRCTLVSRREEVPAFDAAFAAFFERVLPAPELGDIEAAAPPSEAGAEADAGGAPEAGPEPIEVRESVGEEGAETETDADEGTSWSDAERLRHLDFRFYGEAELRAARTLIPRVARLTPRRLSRRVRPTASGRRPDHRRTLQAAMRNDGVPLELRFRERRVVPRKLVFLLDVSGSMEAYSRVMVLFAHAARQASPKVEVFTFGTQLTTLTRELTDRDPGRALRRVAATIPDWAGGTRLGESLKAFHDTAGRRGVSRGAVIVIVSDGWERGDTDLLAGEMARLQRTAFRVVWVNPLTGDPEYQPVAVGMQAALPFVDDFLPGHDLASLEGLAGCLEAIEPRA